jgi:hypothetical protein
MEAHEIQVSAESDSRAESIELPAPTAAPIVAAFGFALILAGLATHEVVAGMGALLALAGLVEWFSQVLPHPAHERVALTGAVASVRTTRRAVEHVAVDLDRVRANLPIELYPVSAGLRGGLGGGVAMAILAVLYGVVSGHGVWYPINLLAAGFFPAATIAELSSFQAEPFAIAVVIHSFTSVLIGVLYGAMLPMLPTRPILLGGLIAPLLWTGILHSSLALINPVLSAQVDWGWFVLSQLAFGVVAGVIVSRRQRVTTAQPLPWQMRAGIEASGLVDEPAGEGREHD